MANRPFTAMTLLLVLSASLIAVPALAFQGILAEPAAFHMSGAWTGGAFAWDIQQDTAGFYHYNYRLVAPDGEPPIGTFLLEVAPSLTAGDIWGTTGNVVVGDFLPVDNPNMPSSVHAIGWLNVNKNRTNFDFDCWKLPVWGDFYVKSGETVPSTAFNVGFTNPDTDPSNPPSDGTISYHILRVGPTEAVPDASTLLLALAGVLPAFAMARRRRAS